MIDNYEDRQRFLSQKYPEMRGDEMQWEEPDIDEKEFLEWLHAEFLIKQKETSEKVCAYIKDTKTGNENDCYLPNI